MTHRNLKQINCPLNNRSEVKLTSYTAQELPKRFKSAASSDKRGPRRRQISGRVYWTTRLTTMGLFTIDQQGSLGIVCLFVCLEAEVKMDQLEMGRVKLRREG